MRAGLGGIFPEQVRDGYRLAIPRGWFDDLDDQTRTAWDRVTEGLKDVDFPSFAVLWKAGTTILSADAAQVHRKRVEEHPDKFGKDVLTNLRRGMEVLATDYQQALEGRDRLADGGAGALA